MVGIARSDLFTTDKYLETIMIENYPGIIKEDQYNKDTTDREKKIYSFYNLDLAVLSKFLEKYQMFPYEVRNSTTGQYLLVNAPKVQAKVLFL